jgi:hypothetical protein
MHGVKFSRFLSVIVSDFWIVTFDSSLKKSAEYSRQTGTDFQSKIDKEIRPSILE